MQGTHTYMLEQLNGGGEESNVGERDALAHHIGALGEQAVQDLEHGKHALLGLGNGRLCEEYAMDEDDARMLTNRMYPRPSFTDLVRVNETERRVHPGACWRSELFVVMGREGEGVSR